MEKLFYERPEIDFSKMLISFNLCEDSPAPGEGEGGNDDNF